MDYISPWIAIPLALILVVVWLRLRKKEMEKKTKLYIRMDGRWVPVTNEYMLKYAKEKHDADL